jgi:hypothetical protein
MKKISLIILCMVSITLTPLLSHVDIHALKSPSETGGVRFGSQIVLKSAHGKYLAAEGNGTLNANRTRPERWTKFTIINVNKPSDRSYIRFGQHIALKSEHGKFVVAEGNGVANANRTRRGAWEKWIIFNPKNLNARDIINTHREKVCFRSAHNKFLVAEGNGAANANRSKAGSWETWRMGLAIHNNRPSTELSFINESYLTPYQVTPANMKRVLGVKPKSTPTSLNTNKYIDYDLNKMNVGNHTQGLAMLKSGNWMVSYSQHWRNDPQPESYYRNKKSLMILGGKSLFNKNKVPARNYIELSGLASCGNVIAGAWGSTTHFYYANANANGAFKSLPHLKFDKGNLVGFTKYGNAYYSITCDGYNRGHLFKRTAPIKNTAVKGWKKIHTSSGRHIKQNFIKNASQNNFPKTKTGAISLFSSGGDLYLGLMEYEQKSSMVARARNFVRIIRIDLPSYDSGKPTFTVVRQFEVRTSPAFDGPNFRWGGDMQVNKKGELEIYSIARVFVEGPNGRLKTMKHTFPASRPIHAKPQARLRLFNRSIYATKFNIIYSAPGKLDTVEKIELAPGQKKTLRIPGNSYVKKLNGRALVVAKWKSAFKSGNFRALPDQMYCYEITTTFGSAKGGKTNKCN